MRCVKFIHFGFYGKRTSEKFHIGRKGGIKPSFSPPAIIQFCKVILAWEGIKGRERKSFFIEH